MRRRLLAWAVGLVRIWARFYTIGLQSDVRRRRRAEIESDVWESLHDLEEAPATTGIHIVARLARGVPADVWWRLEYGRKGEQNMWKRLALLSMATAAVMAMTMLWFLFPGSDFSSLPQLPARPTPIYLVRHRVPPPPPPPPPTWEEFVAKVNRREGQ